jgi:hypothetical protein
MFSCCACCWGTLGNNSIVNPRELHKSYAIGSSFSDIWWLIRAFYSGSFKDKIVLGFPHLKELSLDTRNAHLLEFE